jgi:predicted RNase H-like nuclease (RuvC/YqgF family)
MEEGCSPMSEQNYGRRKADTMPDNNDHDLLVRLDTKVNLLLEQHSSFMMSVTSANKELAERIARLEVKDRGDSEKFQAISIDVQLSLNNSTRISDLNLEVSNLRIELKNTNEELDTLRTKSNVFDYVNAAGAIVSGIVASIIGTRT